MNIMYLEANSNQRAHGMVLLESSDSL